MDEVIRLIRKNDYILLIDYGVNDTLIEIPSKRTCNMYSSLF